MSESRDIGTGQDDNKGNRKLSDLQQEEEGNKESSIPTETGHTDQTHNDFISGSQLGDLPIWDQTLVTSSSTMIVEFKPEKYCFKKELTANDVEHGMILFPYTTVSDHFPAVAGKPSEVYIEISDPWKAKFEMTVEYSCVEGKYFITSNWRSFWHTYELSGPTMIYFFKPAPRLHDKHYMIHFVRQKQWDLDKTESDSDSDDHALDNYYIFSDAESLELNQGDENDFLFKMKVEESDFEDGRLALPSDEVREHFPEIEIPPETHEMERMCFTDARNKNWFVEVTFKNELDAYVVQEGGKEFVDEHDLKATDVMRFFEPDNPWEPRRHLLVECVKGSSHDPWK